MSRCRVVITGRGLVSPLGVGLESHWQALAAGRGAVGYQPRLGALGLGDGRGAVVPAEALAAHLGRLPRKQLKLYNRPTLLGVLAATLALDEARLAPGGSDPERFGVLLGVNVLARDLEAMARDLAESESRAEAGVLDMARANQYCMRYINPLDFSLKTLPNLAAGHLAIAQNAQGLCRALTEDSIGGLEAIGQAWRLVAEGELDAALAGGADSHLEELTFATYFGAGLFGPDGAGPVPGEGGGVLVLEDAEAARDRGGRAAAEILGFASVAGDGVVAPEQDAERLGRRLARAVRAAVDEAGAEPDIVALHGDGLASHEVAEALALDRALGSRAGAVPRLAMKRHHGDLGAASPAVEVIACSAMLEKGTLPAGTPGPADAPARALVLALGVFGECAALMLGCPA